MEHIWAMFHLRHPSSIDIPLDLGRIIAPGGWHETVLVVIGGYIDGSNLHGNVDVIAVAACAANVDSWPLWQAKWRELTDVAEVDRWHHTDFIAHKRLRKGTKDYEIWPEANWLLCRGMLCEAFETINPFCSAVSVFRTDYETVRAQFPSLPQDPYYFLLDRCMWRLIQGMFEHPIDTGIAVYCDQDKDRKIVMALSEWHTGYLHANHNAHHFHPEVATRPVTTSYGSNVQYAPLQAADVVAHEFMSYCRRFPEMPAIGTNFDTGSWIVERLKHKMPWTCLRHNKAMLEMEMNGRAFVMGREPGYRFTG